MVTGSLSGAEISGRSSRPITIPGIGCSSFRGRDSSRQPERCRSAAGPKQGHGAVGSESRLRPFSGNARVVVGRAFQAFLHRHPRNRSKSRIRRGLQTDLLSFNHFSWGRPPMHLEPELIRDGDTPSLLGEGGWEGKSGGNRGWEIR